MTIALTPRGTVPMAVLSDWLGVPLAVGIFGALLLALTLVTYGISTKLQNLDRIISVASE